MVVGFDSGTKHIDLIIVIIIIIIRRVRGLLLQLRLPRLWQPICSRPEPLLLRLLLGPLPHLLLLLLLLLLGRLRLPCPLQHCRHSAAAAEQQPGLAKQQQQSQQQQPSLAQQQQQQP